MKKYIIIILLVAFGLTCQSQVLITLLLGDKLNSPGLEFGLEGGINWAQVSGMETNNFARKWNLGFYFDIRLKNQWSLYTGVLVKANMGVDKLTDNDLEFLNATFYYSDSLGGRVPGEYHQKMSYFMVPAMIKYKFKCRVFVAAGFQASLMHKAWIEFNADLEDIEFTGQEDNKDALNRIDVGAMAGVGYQLRRTPGMSFSVRYYEGFANVYKGIPGKRNRSIYIQATIPIGAGKAAEKAKEKEGNKE